MALALLATVLALQFFSGAWSSDFGADPDEPSHYVTGLMLRQYLLSGFPPWNPLAFARDYYDHYPKVALGHYPPVFYIAEGSWMLLFGPHRVSALVFMAALGAGLAFLTWTLLRAHFGILPSLTAALVGCALPVVQQFTAIVMADLLLSIFCLGAVLAFSRFLSSPRPAHALAFGALAAMAIMTKGSGMCLALFVPVALALSGNLRLLRVPALWLAPLPVILFCAPWLGFTYHITEEGMAREPMLAYLKTAASYFAHASIPTFGFTLIVPAAIGALSLVITALRHRRGIDPFWACILAFPPALIALYCFIPGGLDPRYLIPAVPPLLSLWLLGLRTIAKPLGASPLAAALALCCAALFAWESFRIPAKQIAGYSAAAGFIIDHHPDGTPNGKILISSDARGEGAFIAALAMRNPAPRFYVERSSKVLATSDWLGRDYQSRFRSPEEVRRFLSSASFEWIVTDGAIPPSYRNPHHTLLEDILEAGDAGFILAGANTVGRRVSAGSSSGTLKYFQRQER